MKKTAKTLSIVIMAFAMAMCFFFAGLTFIKADTNATEVGLAVVYGAEVYVPTEGDITETGIRFTVQIPEAGYKALADKASEGALSGGAVHLGVEFGSKVSGEFKPFENNASFTVKTAAPEVANGNMQYTFTLKYNLERIFNNAYPEVGYIESAEVTEENKATYDAQQAQINAMYLKELCIRPWYKIITADGNEGDPVYGNAGDSRSMLHVAIAEINEYNKGLQGNTVLNAESYEYFTTTYLNGGITDVTGENEYTINALGITDIPLNAYETYVLESSGEVVARKGATSLDMEAHLGLYTEDDYITLYGINADRTVVKYTAKYTGFEGIELQSIEGKQPVITADGKMYLNDTSLASAKIDGVFYNGKLISKDGKNINATNITETIGSAVELIIKVGNELYDGTSLYATKAFENTPTSRADLVATFSTGDRKANNSSSYHKRTVEGYYVLVDNIFFAYKDEQGNIYRDEIFQHGDMESRNNLFKATFDGRGYTLNNVIYYDNCHGGMFGIAGDGAVLKNFAINGTVKCTSWTSFSTKTPPYSLIFWRVENATAKVTFDNIYINKTATTKGSYLSVFFYTAPQTGIEYLENYKETGKTVEHILYDTGIVKFNNVVVYSAADSPIFMGSQGYYYEVQWNEETQEYDHVIDEDLYPDLDDDTDRDEVSRGDYAKYPTTVKSTDEVINTYFIGGYFGRYQSTFPQANGENEFKKVSSMSAITDTQDFIDAGCWDLVDGVLVWKTCGTIVAINGEKVSSKTIELNDTEAAYEVSATVDGKDVTSKLTYSIEGDFVSVTNSTIKAKSNAYGTAIVTVSYEENTIATYTFVVDAREATVNTEEILLSKLDGKLYFNNTTLADLRNATFNDSALVTEYDAENKKVIASSSIFANGKINTSELSVTDGKEGSPENYILSINTDAGKYILTNVKVYDGVFENTPYSRALMATRFGGSARTSEKTFEGESISVVTGDLTGYYVLAEDLYFDPYNGDANKENVNTAEMFGGSTDRGVKYFNATFDGRGYSLNNIIKEDTVTSYGIFGAYLGLNGQLLNFAINGVCFYGTSGVDPTGDTKPAKTQSLLFCKAGYPTSQEGNTTKISNVLINIELDDAGSGNIGFFYNAKNVATDAASIGFKTWENTIVNYVRGTEYDGAFQFLSVSNSTTSVDNNATFIDTYFVINGDIWGGSSSNAVHKAGSATAWAQFAGLKTYQNLGDMAKDVANDYSTFTGEDGNGCWIVGAEGIPAWKSTYFGAIAYKDGEVETTPVLEKITDYVTIKVANKGVITEDNITLDAKDSAIVTVSGNKIYPVANKNGSAEVAVIYNGEEIATYTITVNTLVGATLYKGEDAQVGTDFNVTASGETYTIKATIGESDLVVGTDYVVVSNDNSIVYVEENTNVLKIMPNAEGTAIITVTFGGEIIATYNITVNTIANATLYLGENEVDATETINVVSESTYTVVVSFGDTVADVGDYLVESSATEIASVSDNEVNFAGGKLGEVIITVSYAGNPIATYTFDVDTRAVDDIDEEVFASYTTKKIYFNEVEELKGVEISELTLDGVSVLDNGGINTEVLSAINNAYVLKMETSTGALYNLNNFVVYTDVFDNTYESKVRMSNTFGASNDPVASPLVDNLTGYYVLAENITFYNANDTTTDWSKMAFGGYDASSEYAIEEYKGGVQTFNATFDGRGYALNNLIMDHSVKNAKISSTTTRCYNYGMFGVTMGKSAKLMNFAINGIKFLTSTGIKTSMDAYFGALFANAFEANATASGNTSQISNVYIYSDIYARNGSSTGPRGFSLFSSSSAANFGFHSISNTIFVFNMTNIAETSQDENGNSIYASLYFRSGNTKTISTTNKPAFNDTYFVINGNAWGTHAAVNGPEADFAGLSTYTSVANMPTGRDNYANFYGENGNGCWSEDENGLPVWDSTIDKRVPVPSNEEVLVSLYDGTVHLDKTSYANSFIEYVTLNGENIYSDGKITTTDLVASEEAITLNIAFYNGGLYSFNNVKVYDEVFVNTSASIDRMVSELKSGSEAAPNTKLYALAQDIDVTGKTFEASTTNYFAGTFNGRGYVINNYSGDSTNSIFGYGADGVVIKNVAIKVAGFNKSYGAVLFTGVKSSANVTVSNVYINVLLTSAKKSLSCITYRDYSATWNMSNVLVELDFAETVAAENRNASLFRGYGNASGLNGTFNNAYFLSTGAGNTATSDDGKLKVMQGKVVDDVVTPAYATLAEARADMLADENYSADGFNSSECWTIVDGAPVWTGLITAE